MEQVFGFTNSRQASAGPVDWPDFFLKVLTRILLKFGLRCKIATDFEASEIPNVGDRASVALVLMNGIPLMDLEPLFVSHHVWPGLLLPYLKMFRSLASRYVTFSGKGIDFIPTVSLEVLSNAERVMSYLFSGDTRKLGKVEISSHGTNFSIKHRNFALLPSRYYAWDEDLPSIKLEAWVHDDCKRTIFFI